MQENSIKRGKFIVIEGMDRIGKTTLINMIKKEYGDSFDYYEDPSVSLPSAKGIKDLILESAGKVAKTTLMMLYIAARAEVTEYIRKSLDSGRNVICDRYSLGGYIYGSKLIKASYIYDLHKTINVITPDMMIVLYGTPFNDNIDSMEKQYESNEISEKYKNCSFNCKMTKIDIDQFNGYLLYKEVKSIVDEVIGRD